MNNKIKLNGTITRVNEINTSSNGKQYLNFDIALLNKTFITIKAYQDNLEKYKENIKVGNKVELEGYLNSYLKDNIRITYVALSTLTKLDNKKELFYTDKDGNEYWHGKKITKEEATQEEIEELEEMLKPFQETEYEL